MNETDLDRYLPDALKQLYPAEQHSGDSAELGPALRHAAARARQSRTKLVAAAATVCVVVSVAAAVGYLRAEHHSPSAATRQPTPTATPARWAAPCLLPEAVAAPEYVGMTLQQVKTKALEQRARVIVVGKDGSCLTDVHIPAVARGFLAVAIDDADTVVAAAYE